ncbi:MAG: AMP-binding protein, partial [Calditrichota bacterium]
KFEQLIREAADSRITLPAIHAMEEFLATADRKNPGLDRVELPVVSTDSPAVILFTSGTTGFSKGVVLSHSNLIGDVQAIIDTDVIRSDDNFHLILPLHHTYSSTANLLGALALGARATFATSYKSRDLVDDIRLAGITTLVGVPLVFENIMIGIRRSIADAPALKRTLFRLLYGISAAGSLIRLSLGAALFRSLREKAGLGSLRRMISGGAALRPEVNIFFERLGFSLLQGYGLTETSPVLTVNRPGRNRIGSVGTPLPGVELKIDDPDDNGVGEICARGPMIMQGYFENPAATSEVLRDGWFHTGDAGFLDRHGALHITGRLKNVIVTGGGKNVYPEEIEARLDLSPFILESLVVSISRKRGGGEELAALIVPQYTFIKQESERGHMMDVHQEIKTVVEAYNHSVPAYRRLRQWRIQEQEFDKTSTRKIRRYLYKDVFKLADAAK